MINIIDKHGIFNEQRTSINVSYIRNVNIIFGQYAFPDHIHNLMLEVKNNLDPKMKNYTHLKGGMTDWNHFKGHPLFENFLNFVIAKHTVSHPEIFLHFKDRFKVINAWGNQINKGDYLTSHIHTCYHGILYLSEGCPLQLPEINLEIIPEPGSFYIFPPYIFHGFNPSESEKPRYSLIFNIVESDNGNGFTYDEKIRKMDEKTRSKSK